MTIGNEVIKEMNIKNIELSDILKLADEQAEEVYKTFKVKGVISNIAPINEPITYIDRVYQFRNDENNETIISVIPYPLPISKCASKEEKTLAFLYGTDEDSAFEFDCDYEENKLLVNKRNKFVPILIENNLLSSVINKKVKIEVNMIILNSSKINNIYNYRNSEFSELVDLFHDIYNMNVNSIILELEKIIDVEDKKINLGKYSFGVEYKLTNYNCENIETELVKSCEGVRFKNFKIKLFRFPEIGLIPCEKDVFIHIKDNYIGFYIKIDGSSRNLYRSKIKELEGVIQRVLSELKKIGQVEISFISDEEKKNLFE
ncbi:hypothetical protein NSA50_16765 [Clostridium sp. DSM 100503]|uniref:hypothetical protein n=1 Tax=Clostridium sp. DSM 100503 TaxID=2963282 RepID=UPI00214A79C0|nr:hypothetical protein [Clostridium sp. DSM 100503]MCR1952679.1 hypothetical protein [Clostridium sp. DSM 100503]